MKTLITSLLAFIFVCKIAIATDISTTIIKTSYNDVRNNILNSIEERGLNISGINHMSKMLSETKNAFGFKKDIYKNAEIIEFCSARISQELSRANHTNILICPFKIVIYSLVDSPENIHLIYKIPKAVDEKSAASLNKVIDLIESIVEDASW